MADVRGAPRVEPNSPGTSEPSDDRLVWIDLEMTGLDITQHTIVEIACVVTDANLDTLDDGVDLVIHAGEAELGHMDDYVRNMHTKSDLLTAIEQSNITVEAAQEQVLTYVRGHVPVAGLAPLCGNSIGVDRRFLDRYMRELDGYLHYRSVDVSSLKELCRRWYPEIYRKRPGKAENHRALHDILESIAELRYYREHMFNSPRP